MAHHLSRSSMLTRMIMVQTAEQHMIHRTRRELQRGKAPSRTAVHSSALVAGASLVTAVGGLAMVWSSVLLRSAGA